MSGVAAARRVSILTTVILGAHPVEGLAEEPSAQVFEVMAGVNGDSSAQAVALRFVPPEEWGPGPGETEGRAALVFENAAGERTGVFVFPSHPAPGVPDGSGFHSVLLATEAFAAIPGAPTPDFILPERLLVAGGGRVCFRANPADPRFAATLCLAYGDFHGDTGTDGASPATAAGPPAPPLPITGVKGLRRFRNFGAEHMGARQINADFRIDAIEARNGAGESATIAELPGEAQGRKLFFEEAFGGNGRTCGTCHVESEGFALSAQSIADLPASDPLFVFETVPALGALESGAHLRGARGLILENIDGFDEPPSFRGSPALINLKFTAPFGLSGEIATLDEFTTGAVKQHFPRTLARNADPAVGPLDIRLPSAEELSAMTAFMESLTIELQLDRMMASAVIRGASAEQVRRGRSVFFSQKAKCFKCHSGPAFADVDASMVADGVVPGPGNHSFETGVARRGDVRALPPPHELGREFDTRPLVGVSLRKAFFHDNSAKSLEEAVDFYCTGCDDNFFTLSDAFTKIGGMQFNDSEERLAVTEFLRALVEPDPRCSAGLDCNGNTLSDVCELALYPERDCNDNGAPDTCEEGSRDCNSNAVDDACEVARNPGLDCNGNGIPDACEILADPGDDCNGNGKLDACEPGNVLDASEPELLAPGRAVLLGGIQVPFEVTGAGDINADGVDDLLIGGRRGATIDPPEVFVVFGDPGLGGQGPLDVTALDGKSGFSIAGLEIPFPSSDFHLSRAGDVNGDGVDDFIIGNSNASRGGMSGAGKVHVVFGREGIGAAGSLDVSLLDGTMGFVLEGAKAQDGLGSSVGAGGDVNGDGLADLIAGAPFADPGENAAGAAYVILGAPGHAPLLTPETLDGRTGFAIHGAHAADFAGGSVALGGDVNGDGFGDMLVGASGADPGGLESAGEAYVVFGGPAVGAGGVVSLRDLDPSRGFVLRGRGQLDALLRLAVAFAGDLNGDGYQDIAVGAHNADPAGAQDAGEAYVIFGGSDPAPAGAIDLGALDGTRGFALRGAPPGARLGATLAALGDTQDDGFADLAIGTAAGRDFYVLYGRADIGAGGVVAPDSMAPDVGVIAQVRVEGEDLSQFFLAGAVSGAGDVNGDGFDDMGCAILAPPPKPGDAFVLLAPLYPRDCDGDGQPDECEVSGGSAPDENGNGVPDACELVRFRAGDVSADGSFDISDPISILRCLFLLDFCLAPCAAAGDVDGSGDWNITDAVYSLNYLFLGGPPPVHPFEECGTRGFSGVLRCAGYPPCN